MGDGLSLQFSDLGMYLQALRVADSVGLGWTSNKFSGHDDVACLGITLAEASGSKNPEDS